MQRSSTLTTYFIAKAGFEGITSYNVSRDSSLLFSVGNEGPLTTFWYSAWKFLPLML